MRDVAELMSVLSDNDVYFYSSGDDRPWSDEKGARDFVFHCGGRRITINSSSLDSISYLSSSFDTFFNPQRFAISWNSKDLFSFLRGRTGVAMSVSDKFYDLDIISSYLSVDAQCPLKRHDAFVLFKELLCHPGWPEFKKLYFEIYVPLISKVLPEIESCGLVDNSKRMLVYPLYIPEGQSNGRLKALVRCESNYNPHTMSLQQKMNIRPTDYDSSFVHFDYRNMEVNVLGWLSGDRNLNQALKNDEDAYRSIWAMSMGSKPSDKHRAICKSVFLPLVFGMGRRAFSEKIGCEEKISAKIIDRMVKTFPVAFDWVSSQAPCGDNIAKDFFGRRRKFEEDDFHKIRNFSVQSPASMICLRKLVRLHDALEGIGRICFHVHDGYCVVCRSDKIDKVFEIGTEVLEEEDDLFPGLHLKTSCSYGNRLDTLKIIQKGIDNETHTRFVPNNRERISTA